MKPSTPVGNMLAFMPTRIVHIVIDANDSARQAELCVLSPR